MLFLALLAVFAIASLVTSALAHDERRWRYSVGVTIACAMILVSWTANLLSAGLHYLSHRIDPLMAVLIAATPYVVVVFNLWIRRRRTPRHTPGLNDDPVLRRYLEEKLRRHRQRRQAEALESTSNEADPF